MWQGSSDPQPIALGTVELWEMGTVAGGLGLVGTKPGRLVGGGGTGFPDPELNGGVGTARGKLGEVVATTGDGLPVALSGGAKIGGGADSNKEFVEPTVDRSTSVTGVKEFADPTADGAIGATVSAVGVGNGCTGEGGNTGGAIPVTAVSNMGGGMPAGGEKASDSARSSGGVAARAHFSRSDGVRSDSARSSGGVAARTQGSSSVAAVGEPDNSGNCAVADRTPNNSTAHRAIAPKATPSKTHRARARIDRLMTQ